jgi:hypothetical protein
LTLTERGLEPCRDAAALEADIQRADQRVQLILNCLVAIFVEAASGVQRQRGREQENSVSIRVERVANCVRRFDLYHALGDLPDFRDGLQQFMDTDREFQPRPRTQNGRGGGPATG